MEEAWDESLYEGSSDVLNRCLESFRARLEVWNEIEFGNVGKTMAELQKKLEWLELQPSTLDMIRSLRNPRIELNCWMDKEDDMWRQRSRISWLQSGDRNTRFFYEKASARYKNNLIKGLMDENGRWLEGDEYVEKLMLQYYEMLFTSSDHVEFEEILDAVQHKVTPRMNQVIVKEFSKVEAKNAIKQMYHLKSLGPDGMPPLFYQHFWPNIGGVVTSTFLDFPNSGIIPPNFNHTHNFLIPKCKEPKTMTNYRPISLCNVVYKIVLKAITNRWKKVLPSIIIDTQSAFVHGRLITDNVLVAYEMMHHISQKKSGRMGDLALKLDISKAYDRVEWIWLEKIMQKLGFDNKWCALIMKCVTTVSYSVKINGKPKWHIVPSRGIRQGDPLSPYLFLLCAEGLSALIKKEVENGRLGGVAVCHWDPKISHLFFADDSLIFC